MARHDQHDRPGRHGPGRRGDRDPRLAVFIVAPLLFLGLISAADMLRREFTRPAIGDMVVFSTLSGRERIMFHVVVPAWRTDPQARGCMLESGTMARRGGSLIVLRRLPGETPRYHVGWVGGATAEGPDDCGPDTRLEIGRVDLRKLATATGGFHRPQPAPPRRDGRGFSG